MICDKEGPTKWEDALSPSNKTEFCYRIQNKEPRKNIILDSSMVEHSAVNRVVAGSSPARGARAKEESGAAVPKLKRIRLRGQAVKTSPFHGGNTGSIPVGVIWRHSQVVRQRSATPLSPVQIWLAPLIKNTRNIYFRVFLSKNTRKAAGGSLLYIISL